MFYQLLHTGCILKTLPGRFGFLFWYQRFSSSDPINQCAAPGFRHGERGPVVLMLNVYFFFSFVSLFIFSPPSTFVFQGPALISLQNLSAQHRGMNFPMRSNMRYLPLKYWWSALRQQKKKKRKKRLKVQIHRGVPPVFLCPNRWVGFLQRSQLATTIFCRNDQFC